MSIVLYKKGVFMEKWNERFRQLREERGYSQGELAEKLNTDIPTISRYERGKGAKKISKNFRHRLLTFFDDDEMLYIETGILKGKVKDHFEVNDIAPIIEEMDEYTKTKKIQEISNMYQSGSNNTQVAGDRNKISPAEMQISGVSMPTEPEDESITLEYYPETYASAGGGAYPYLEDSTPMSFSKSFLTLHLGLSNFKNIFILNTTGESMEPTLKNGSLIFVNPIENEDDVIRDGGIYVIMCEDTMLVKRVTINPITKAYTLVSDHEKHENITIEMFHESGCRFLGRVVGSFDKI